MTHLILPGRIGASWQQLAGMPAISADVLAETLDGGQAFRWHRQPDGSWIGIWSNHVVCLRLNHRDRLEWRALASPAPEHVAPPAAKASSHLRTSDPASTVAAVLDTYFGLDRDFPALTDSLPWRSDTHLARCIAAFPGLRILRQPLGETLLCFLCSATKQIVQIKQMVALLAARHGAPLLPGNTPAARTDPESVPPHVAVLHRLPTWSELAEIPEPELRACLLGFRARYISQTAKFLAANPGWLEQTETLPYAAAKERLCTLPGVGEKVADCVLLFGAGRLEAFPVDVWILKTLARRYGLEGWRPPQLAQFGRVHFGTLAGLAQQFLFAWERKTAKGERRREQGAGNAITPP